MFRILLQISPKFVLEVPINNKSTSFQVMVLRWADDKPLAEVMIIRFTDTYTRHQIWVNAISAKK